MSTGPNSIVADDINLSPVKFKKLIAGTAVLGRKITAITEKGENVGIMLPNTVACLVSFFSMQAIGRVPAMINFSSGIKAMLSACKTAKIKTVITSRKFIEASRMEATVEQMAQNCNLIYIEDLAKSVSIFDKIYIFLSSPARMHKKFKVKSEDPAVILFTSGSEGEPKGVVLSHENIMTNIVQLSSRPLQSSGCCLIACLCSTILV